MNKIAACVVLYNPDFAVISNINSYYNHVNYLIVVDNSETKNIPFLEELHKCFSNVIYKSLNRNAGIAAALNIGCEIGITNDCNWILTMDQDSSFYSNEVLQLINSIPVSLENYKHVGIISPFHVLYSSSVTKEVNRYSVKNIVMTSGNLLNLSAYAITGIFNEKLFMDYVDYEYCLRLRRNNFKIIQDNSVRLKHALGNFEIKMIVGQKIGISNHNSLRRYYMTRNSLYVGFKYWRIDKVFFINVLKNILFWDPLLIVAFEKNKQLKLKAMFKGIFHFLSGKYEN